MSNNKQRGNAFERYCVTSLNKLGFNLITTRQGSKQLDDEKVDIMNKDVYDKFPIHIQCKTTASKLDYFKIMDEMPKGPKAIWHKLTEKKGSRFVEKTKVVVLSEDAFLLLMQSFYNDSKQQN